LISTTYGLGEAILDALNSGFRQFIIGIGGSATNDGGAGMAQALGVKLLDSSNNDLCLGGADLARLAKIDMSGLDERIKDSNISVACDVTNPLTGPTGASAVYGPQKGATPDMVQQLDKALKQLAIIARRDLGIEIDELPGAGAAGGLGAGMVGFLSGRLQAGVDIVLNTVGLASNLEGADLVLTGEGSLDYQTVYNKAPVGVSRMAKSKNIPVIAISGSLGEGYKDVHNHGIDAAIAITNRPMTLGEASENAYTLVADATEQALRLFMSGNQKPTL
jgi:glycerate kinase